MKIFAALAFVIATTSSFAASPDWGINASVPETGRENVYQYSDQDLQQHVNQGRTHALFYPVEITGMLPPHRPFEKVMNQPEGSLLKAKFKSSFEIREPIQNAADFYRWLGLKPYPAEGDTGIYQVPYPNGVRPDYPMGLTIRNTADGAAFTFSCAACHAGTLFGKQVLGMANRFPRANKFFVKSRALAEQVPAFMFQLFLGATAGETRLFSKVKENVQYLDAKSPQVLGLDTSLAHTAASLARRTPDPMATRDPYYADHPGDEPLLTQVADSRPMPWWTAKYKNKWLSDGAVVSGNPILTNFVWNEIGRASDLQELSSWLGRNRAVVDDLTAAVFASKAPRFTDFFPAESIDMAAARRGETLFLANCSRCHGVYEKGWNVGDGTLTNVEQLRTTRVLYHNDTPVLDVGTDAHRYSGMNSLALRLNRLAISQQNNIVVEPHIGYVPPPLDGIWARWPYFHNGSAPSLCAVLTRSSDRPSTFYAGEAVDRARDFDRRCNGYPIGTSAPAAWRLNTEAFYDTSRDGMGNMGHDEGIFLDRGTEIFTNQDKDDLIAFLQTL